MGLAIRIGLLVLLLSGGISRSSTGTVPIHGDVSYRHGPPPPTDADYRAHPMSLDSLINDFHQRQRSLSSPPSPLESLPPSTSWLPWSPHPEAIWTSPGHTEAVKGVMDISSLLNEPDPTGEEGESDEPYPEFPTDVPGSPSPQISTADDQIESPPLNGGDLLLTHPFHYSSPPDESNDPHLVTGHASNWEGFIPTLRSYPSSYSPSIIGGNAPPSPLLDRTRQLPLPLPIPFSRRDRPGHHQSDDPI